MFSGSSSKIYASGFIPSGDEDYYFYDYSYYYDYVSECDPSAVDEECTDASGEAIGLIQQEDTAFVSSD